MIFKKHPLLRFGATAVIVFSVDFALLFAFHSILELGLRLSIVMAFVSAFAVNFSLNSFWVFQGDEFSGRSLIRFIQLVVFNLVVQAALVPLLTNSGLNYLVAKLIVVGILFIVNFQISRRYVFPRKLNVGHESQDEVGGS
jgi:putative flippase GtrA